jgi:MoxR-like ATPase
MNALQNKVVALRSELNGALLERDVAIEAALLALLSGEHVLYLGPPGVGKSFLIRAIVERLLGATYFEKLLTRFSTPEELFGPLSLAALERDEYRRVSKGMLTEAHLAFIDECYKANSAILNSLLTIVNERLYHENGVATRVPLLSLFAASNESPEDDSLAALHDRFMLRVMVPYLSSDDSMRALLDMAPAAPTVALTLDELRTCQTEVAAMPLATDARETIIAIKHALESEGIAVSDRRWRSIVKIVKAKAWLAGDATTSSDHCEVLVNALWSDPAQIRVVERCIAKVCNPLNLEAVELEDAAKDIFDSKPAADAENITRALEPLLRQLGDIHTRLAQRINSTPEAKTFRARQAQAKIAGWHRELSTMALKSLSRLHLAPGSDR